MERASKVRTWKKWSEKVKRANGVRKSKRKNSTRKYLMNVNILISIKLIRDLYIF